MRHYLLSSKFTTAISPLCSLYNITRHYLSNEPPLATKTSSRFEHLWLRYESDLRDSKLVNNCISQLPTVEIVTGKA